MDATTAADPVSTLFTVQTARELLTVLQDRESSGSTGFPEALKAAEAGTDVLELSPAASQGPGDPTTSALFQAHIGAFGNQGGPVGGVPPAEGKPEAQVNSVISATATGRFTSETPLQSSEFQLAGPASSRKTPYAVAEDFAGIYDAQTTQVIHRLGTRLDVKG